MPPSGGGSGHTHPNLLSLNRLGVSSAGKLTIDSVEFTQNAWKDPVSLVGDLPASGNTVGDTRLVTSDNTVYAWTDEGTWARIAASGVQTVSAGSSALAVTSADPLNPVVDLSQGSKDSLTHTNRTTLDKLGETGGALTFNGAPMSSLAFSGVRAIGPSTNAASGAWTNITFTGIGYDTDNYHPTSNNSFTIPYDGYYLINCTVKFAANGTGTRTLQLSGNTGSAPSSSTVVQGTSPASTLCKIDYVSKFIAGNILNVSVTQNSGTTLAVTDSEMTITRLG